MQAPTKKEEANIEQHGMCVCVCVCAYVPPAHKGGWSPVMSFDAQHQSTARLQIKPQSFLDHTDKLIKISRQEQFLAICRAYA